MSPKNKPQGENDFDFALKKSLNNAWRQYNSKCPIHQTSIDFETELAKGEQLCEQRIENKKKAPKLCKQVGVISQGIKDIKFNEELLLQQ